MQTWEATKAAARAGPRTVTMTSATSRSATNSDLQSPLARAVDGLEAAGYASFLRPVAQPGTPVIYKNGIEKESNGKIPNRYNGHRWTGWPGWRAFKPAERDIAEWRTWPNAGLALVTGKVDAFDIDIRFRTHCS